jgi:hypothetical protein
MDVELIVVGVALLGIIATAIGLAQRGEQVSRDRAWREIARERRRLWEERRQLEELRAEWECGGISRPEPSEVLPRQHQEQG